MPYYDDQADLTEAEIEYATRWARELVVAHVQREGLPLTGGEASKVSARAIALGMKFAKMAGLVLAGARAKWPDVDAGRGRSSPPKDKLAGLGLGSEPDWWSTASAAASAADEKRMADDDT